MNKIKLFLILITFVSISLYAQEHNRTSLIIGVKSAPPFAMQTSTGKWEGVSIDLWKDVAKKLDINYSFKEYKTLSSLINSVKNENVDIAISAITATANRELFADFSNGYYTEELAIAIPKNEGSILRALLSKEVLYTIFWIVLAVIIVIHIAGFAFWLTERNTTKDNPIKGIHNGIWWAAVTMTTVGYGDITPKSIGGKIVAIVWMFISMFLVALLIASITSLFATVNKEYFITKPNDLNSGSIATIEDSFSDKYLRDRDIVPVYYSTLDDVVRAVAKKEVDAAVYDKDLLQYIINKKYKNRVEITQAHFMPQNYAFMFRNNFELKELINRAILEITESDEWKKIKRIYLLH